jgi:NTE family protein
MSPPFRALGLGGGGVKGILHIGALQELSKHQPLHFPNGVYGSSIGSVLAAYVAVGLPIDKTVTFIKKYLSFEAITPKMNFQLMSSAFSSKGVYSMDKFEENVVSMFEECGLDIRTKTISDAHMPLFIVASNITKGTPTIFSGTVPVLDALKASCCIPGLFRPHTLYNQLYVDGDVLVPNIGRMIPSQTDPVVFILSVQRRHTLTPLLIENMSPIDYISELYSMTKHIVQQSYVTPDTLSLKYPNLHSDSDLTTMDVSDILNSARSQLDGFLGSKTAY